MLNRLPLLLLFLGFVAGVFAAGFINVNSTKLLIVSCISFALLALAIFYHRARQWYIFLAISISAGYALTGVQDDRHNAHHYTKLSTGNGYFLGRINAPPKPTTRATRLTINLLATCAGAYKSVNGKAVLYVPKDSVRANYVTGDWVLFRAHLKPASAPKNPYEFDYKNYLNLHQLYWQGYSPNIKRIATGSGLKSKIDHLRQTLLNTINNLNLTREEQAVASALLLGYRYNLSSATEQAFAGAGAMHVLAVSGLHVGILYLITAFILRLNTNKKHRNSWPKVALIIAVIWSYALLTGLSPSVSRAALMFTFISCGALLRRQPSTYQAILASAFMLLVINPNNLFEVGFQLSYAAVFGILYIQPKLYYLWQPRLYLIDKIWAITTVSIAAQLATFPLGLYYFHQFPTLFLISNLVVIPGAYVLMCYGIFLLFFGSFMSVPAVLLWPFKLVLEAVIKTVHVVESIPHAVIHQLTATRFELVMFMLLVFSFISALFLKQKRSLWGAILSVFILLGAVTWRKHQNINSHRLTFYSVQNEFAVYAQSADTGVLIADSSLLKNESRMLFHINHHLWATGTNPKMYGIDEDDSSELHHTSQGVMDIMGKRILLYKQHEDSLRFNLKPDIIYVAKNVSAPVAAPKTSTILLQRGLTSPTINSWLSHPNIKNLNEGYVSISL